jgi:DNA-binding winged helix-turn-helix (wHTH) protein
MRPREDVVCFGPFEADLRTGELRRDGARVELQELPFRVLAALVSRPGELLTRDDLRALAWPSGVFVDFEHGLNKAVNKIRRALGDSAGAPRYVETLPGRGYRFVAPLRERVPGRVARPIGCRLLWEGRTIALAQGEHIIGREPDAAVCVDSSTVSRRHARIVLSGGSATIEDLGSKNGTLVRGRRVTGPTVITDGDEIAVGSARMTFRSTTAGSTETAGG